MSKNLGKFHTTKRGKLLMSNLARKRNILDQRLTGERVKIQLTFNAAVVVVVVAALVLPPSLSLFFLFRRTQII